MPGRRCGSRNGTQSAARRCAITALAPVYPHVYVSGSGGTSRAPEPDANSGMRAPLPVVADVPVGAPTHLPPFEAQADADGVGDAGVALPHQRAPGGAAGGPASMRARSGARL